MSVAQRATATASLKLEDDFAAALTLRGTCDRSFDFAKRIGFFDFCFEQAASGHFKEWLKRLHALRGRGVVVPFIDPDAAKSQVFENEKAGRNFQRLQAHRAKAHESAASRQTVSETQRAVATNGV